MPAFPSSTPIIGVIGGMGPHAGLDLVEKILALTPATKDQDYLPVALLSYPDRIPDRSTFLMDPSQPSPVPPLTAIARQLDDLGATVAGIPCNTAHAPAIFDAVSKQLRDAGHQLRLVHMIDEAVRHVQRTYADLRRIGTMATLAVHRLKLYRTAIERAGFEPIVPDERVQVDLINPTIFDPEWGLKVQASPPTDRARQSLLEAIDHLRRKGAEAIFLGCTELPLAVPESHLDGVRLIDPTRVLARALVRETYPDRLSAPASDQTA
jgi:aspartate racemase